MKSHTLSRVEENLQKINNCVRLVPSFAFCAPGTGVFLLVLHTHFHTPVSTIGTMKLILKLGLMKTFALGFLATPGSGNSVSPKSNWVEITYRENRVF